MTRVLVALLLLAGLLRLGTAHAEPDRHGYVARALAAVRSLGDAGRMKLDREMYAAVRTRCHGDDETPTASCLIEAARGVCGTDATCLAAADVIATNLRGTNELLDDAARMRILRKARDYRAELTAELSRRYAILAAELVLATPRDRSDPAAAIDELCTQRDQSIHACEAGAIACIPSVPWSRCVAMLVWFVGSNAKATGDAR